MNESFEEANAVWMSLEGHQFADRDAERRFFFVHGRAAGLAEAQKIVDCKSSCVHEDSHTI